MIGPRHQPTYLDVVTFENEIDRHHKRLGDIQNGVSRRKNIDRDAINAKFGGREKVLKFHNSEKALAIERDNELLLGRLVEISRKRQNPLFPLKEKEPNQTSKSLNHNFRKKEKDRIAAENEAFARRLLSQQPSFNRRKLDDDYERHSERVRLMQKAGGFSNKIKLPPISYHKYEDLDISRKSQSGKEKRSLNELGKKKSRKSKMEKLNEDEREDIAEQEEQREKEESERLLREAREQGEREEAERKEKKEKEQQERELEEKRQREQHDREEAERKAQVTYTAQEEHEKAERIKREEEEKANLEAQKNKNPSETNVGNPVVKK